MPDQESSRTWGRLIVQMYKGSALPFRPMNVIAVIADLQEDCKILRRLVKVGRSPRGLERRFV